MLLSRVNEIVELAREYIKKYNLTPQKAMEYAITNIEIKIEQEEKKQY
ncbi:hypothetical protein [Intestinibacter bartlettii]|nr:MAG TPA: hypothetical protein [Caudoviricetes sp.]DAW52242.1 MAG TPA: hypothetical protein [Caudoviricetes sp.]DAY91483.1 MAG TPA: hypothetical protein [Caudoviricetes sp.]